MFLRITPFLPNWFINMCAPLVDVPLLPFWAGTFFGKYFRKYTILSTQIYNYNVTVYSILCTLNIEILKINNDQLSINVNKQCTKVNTHIL